MNNSANSGGFVALRYFSDENTWIDFVVIVKSEDRMRAIKAIELAMYEYWDEVFECYGDAVQAELKDAGVEYKIIYHDCDDESAEYEKHWEGIIESLNCELVNRIYGFISGIDPDQKFLVCGVETDRVYKDKHGYINVLFATRSEAEEAIKVLDECIQKYKEVSICDLFAVAGISLSLFSFDLARWYIWNDLSGAKIIKRNNNWVITFSQPRVRL